MSHQYISSHRKQLLEARDREFWSFGFASSYKGHEQAAFLAKHNHVLCSETPQLALLNRQGWT